MTRRSTSGLLLAISILSASGALRADVVESSEGHYRLRQEATSILPREALWQRLLNPQHWWSPAHTYSGDAANLDLEARAGGLWKESWEGGEVAHGRVLYLQAPQTLRLEAPFGPLQDAGAYTVWTINLEDAEDGTRVVFDETAVAAPGARMDVLAPAVDTVKTEAIARLVAPGDDFLQSLVSGTATTPALSGLQVSLMEGGQATESFAIGFAQLDESGETALRRDHKVRVASISKLVVALGVMRLVEDGLLDLDADVSAPLGFRLRNPAFPDTPITARQLLAHTSSIRDGAAYFIAAGEGELRDFFDPESSLWDDGAHFARASGQQPGRYFVYSNLNFGLLGTLIETLSGQRFDQYMRRRVLEPLGLSASFNPCDIPEGQLAAAFRKGDGNGNWRPGGPWVAQVDGEQPRCFYGMRDDAQAQEFLAAYRPGSNASLFSPQGGLRASADELVTVLSLLAAGGQFDGTQLLGEASVTAMLAPEWTLNEAGDNGLSAGEAEPGGPTEGLMTSYGLSVHRIDMRAWGFDTGPEQLVGHLGEAYGVLSHALYDPLTGDGIATIITGTADDPAAAPAGHSPLYRVEEAILRWWLARR